MTASLNKNIQHDKYRGQQVTYAQKLAPTMLIISLDSVKLNKWMMADTKKKFSELLSLWFNFKGIEAERRVIL